MQVLVVDSSGRQSGCSDVETMWFAQVNVLVRVLRDAWPDEREIELSLGVG